MQQFIVQDFQSEKCKEVNFLWMGWCAADEFCDLEVLLHNTFLSITYPPVLDGFQKKTRYNIVAMVLSVVAVKSVKFEKYFVVKLNQDFLHNITQIIGWLILK